MAFLTGVAASIGTKLAQWILTKLFNFLTKFAAKVQRYRKVDKEVDAEVEVAEKALDEVLEEHKKQGNPNARLTPEQEKKLIDASRAIRRNVFKP